VSNEGLERVARSIGLECLWEDNLSGGPKSKTLFIAGKGLTLEIAITNHVVENVSLTFPDCTPGVQQHVGKAADILLRDLKLESGQWALLNTLEKFAPNLERLASLDRLSHTPMLNCYDAIDGLYQSLLKIHNWDVAKLKEDSSNRNRTDDYLRVAALYKAHGCPQMHARDRIGLSLDYWKERRRLPTTSIRKSEKDGVKTWSILIECAPKNDMAYMPVRVSEHWISDAIEKTANLTDAEMLTSAGPILDWQEPENTLVPADAGEKPEGAMSQELKLPDVIFMAAFDPPLIVSSAVAAQIHSIADVPPPNVTSATFDALLFPVPPGSPYDPTESRIVTRLQPVATFPVKGPMQELLKEGDKGVRVHKNTLNTDRAVYGEVLTKVPISHPRQLMHMLPMLRQYAFLTSLLASSFHHKKRFPEIPQDESASNDTATAQDEFASFMNSSADKTAAAAANTNAPAITPYGPAFPVDIALTAHPVPQLRVVFPFRSRTANITLQIELGGKVNITSDNVFGTDGESDYDMEDGGGKGKRRRLSRAEWADMLEVTEDIGMWVERIKYVLDG
jgi:hypothetical protein